MTQFDWTLPQLLDSTTFWFVISAVSERSAPDTAIALSPPTPSALAVHPRCVVAPRCTLPSRLRFAACLMPTVLLWGVGLALLSLPLAAPRDCFGLNYAPFQSEVPSWFPMNYMGMNLSLVYKAQSRRVCSGLPHPLQRTPRSLTVQRCDNKDKDCANFQCVLNTTRRLRTQRGTLCSATIHPIPEYKSWPRPFVTSHVKNPEGLMVAYRKDTGFYHFRGDHRFWKHSKEDGEAVIGALYQGQFYAPDTFVPFYLEFNQCDVTVSSENGLVEVQQPDRTLHLHVGGTMCCPNKPFPHTRVITVHNAVVLLSKWIYAVYHTVVEGVLRLLQVVHLVWADPKMKIITAATDRMFEFLRLLKIDPSRVVRASLMHWDPEFTSHFRVTGRLIVPNGVPHHNPPKQLLDLLRCLTAKYRVHPPQDSRPLILVIQRKPGSKRSLRQHSQLMRLLRMKLGHLARISVFSHSQIPSVAATMRLFSSLSVLIGPHGAGIGSNIIYCNPGSHIIELLGNTYMAGGAVNLANILGLHHHMIVADQPDKDGPMSVNVTAAVEVATGALQHWIQHNRNSTGGDRDRSDHQEPTSAGV